MRALFSKKFVLQNMTRVVLVTFSTNIAFAYKPEESFWKERRKQETIQVASLPSNFLPAITSQIPNSRSQIPDKFQSLISQTGISVNRNYLGFSAWNLGFKDALPADLLSHVNLRDSYKGTSQKTVVLLEDIHLNKEAQGHLSSAIKSFGELKGNSPIV